MKQFVLSPLPPWILVLKGLPTLKSTEGDFLSINSLFYTPFLCWYFLPLIQTPLLLNNQGLLSELPTQQGLMYPSSYSNPALSCHYSVLSFSAFPFPVSFPCVCCGSRDLQGRLFPLVELSSICAVSLACGFLLVTDCCASCKHLKF